MRIVCPNCSTSYEIADDAVAKPRAVRCARCATQWVVEPAAALSEPAPEWSVAGMPSVAAEAAHAADHADAVSDGRAIAVIAPDVAPLAPTGEAEPGGVVHDIDAEPTIDIETVAARGAKIAQPAHLPERKRRRSRLASVILLLAAVVAALLLLRTQIVRVLPQTAGAYAAVGLPVNLRGLDFTNVRTSEEISDGVPVLVVEGDIVNVTRKLLEVPRLRFAVRNPAGVEVYAWTAQPAQPMLGPEETLPFRSRLASPPADARDVQVRFFHRRDLERGR